MKVILQYWEESEGGWGVRPDGYSLHLSRDLLRQYIEQYWNKKDEEVTDEYSRPIIGGVHEVEVDETTYREILDSENGIRKYR